MSYPIPVRVLVVDDSEMCRQAMCDVVAATLGFEVVGDAASGREALALVGTLDVELVLLDLQMPEMDGIETALRIRRLYPDVVVRLITAAGRRLEVDLALTVDDKRDRSSQGLVEFWRRHSPRQ